MRILLSTVLIIALTLTLLLAWAGYFDETVFIPVSPSASPNREHVGVAVVYVSGDVGYKAGMGRMMGSRLAGNGIPVVAINSLGYFRNHRTLKEVRDLVAEAIRRALRLRQTDRVVLIGHSLGADALQAGLAGLDPSLRAKVSAVVLIVPTDQLYLQISPGEMLGWTKPDAPALPSLRRLDWTSLVCIYGIEEGDSPCPQLTGSNVTKVALPGGHALHWDIAEVHRIILRAIEAETPLAQDQAPPHSSHDQTDKGRDAR